MKFFTLLAATALLTLSLTAQDTTEPTRGPDLGTTTRVHGIQVLPASGRPFSARDHIVWTRNLEDGNVVQTELYATVLRDSQGRIYREHRSFVPLNSNQPSKKFDIVLLDPVNHTRTTCILATRRCAITDFQTSPTFVPPPVGPFANGTRYLSRESLGDSVVDDLDVTGTRESLYINPGVMGNERLLVNTKEYWYSADLQVNLSVTRKDPREGTQVLQLVDLTRSDPDPALFQVPPGFVIRDLRYPSAKTTN